MFEEEVQILNIACQLFNKLYDINQTYNKSNIPSIMLHYISRKIQVHNARQVSVGVFQTVF